MMKYLIALFAVVALAALAYAQQVAPPLGPNGIACAYNTSLPTLTTGNAGWVQCDSTGHLLISGSVTANLDPCSGAKTTTAFSTGTSGTQLFAGGSTKNTYICALAVIASAAANFSLVSGSGSSVCTGGTPYALIGSTTAANGMAFAANGGLTLGNGLGTVASDKAAVAQAYNVCILINGTANLAGSISYVQQ